MPALPELDTEFGFRGGDHGGETERTEARGEADHGCGNGQFNYFHEPAAKLAGQGDSGEGAEYAG